MQIQKEPMGDYMTNCYIVTIGEKDLIIDPGMDATEWVLENTTNPVAILNTHGHFDHVWSDAELQEKLKIPVYIPKDDAFMLRREQLGRNMPLCHPNFLVQPDEELEISGIKVKFHHFAGHTPGNSAIEIKDTLFAGDFIFKEGIGRVDFPYSSPEDMKTSIKKFIKNYNKDSIIYSGHGPSTNTADAKRVLKMYLNYL